ncbi:MAG: fumarylacetoacetate hydrolase family protein [Rhodospirillaceae bacterium]|nr:fumarylacetoacetate hydrolase family protein [Rhodospirillaceae bacterium]MBT6610413.1 fumarylacetoacetate hydrolase family protein [Rhodospirillaceae bacterium]
MKFLRYGSPGDEKPGFIDENGRIRDLSDQLTDLEGVNLEPERLAALAKFDPSTLPVVEGTMRMGVPVAGVGKIVAVGLNYRDHAEETGMDLPNEPVLFSKAITALNGPNDPVILPKGSTKGDWEVELGIVIGRTARYVKRGEAAAHIAGYTVFNDVSERAMQLEGTGQWMKGKSADTFAPVGPWLVTPDEVPDPQNLNIWLDVNGQRQQVGNTKTMEFGVHHLISYISNHMKLMPGDIIATGTPPGVGLGKSPPMFLKPGDEMRLGVEGLGEQRQKVIAYRPAG